MGAMIVNVIKRFLVFLLIVILHSACRQATKETPAKEIQEMEFNDVKFPAVKFDKDINEILVEYKRKYGAEGVTISRPFDYTSKDDYHYWLKVELRNLKGDKPFDQLGEEVAIDTYRYLGNDVDFEKIEVATVNKKGFVITFSSRQNEFFYRDSVSINR
jgi:hypothetical protein